jgi:hypothetical protein
MSHQRSHQRHAGSHSAGSHTPRREPVPLSRARTTTVALAAIALVVPVMGATAGPATAATRYTIRADSVKPAACRNHGTVPAGAWIANKPCGYVLGTAMAGSSFDSVQTTGAGFRFGRIGGDVHFCGWVAPRSFTGSPHPVAGSCSGKTRAYQLHRLSFGRNFNAKPHAAVTGSDLKVDATCARFFNHFTDSTFTRGELRDQAPVSRKAHVAYRYTTRDGNAMMVLDATPGVGWVFMSTSCAGSIPYHENGDDDR